MRESFVFIVGKPVDELSNVDYVSTLFTFKDAKRKDAMAVKARKTRAEHRRKMTEAEESEKERRSSALEGHRACTLGKRSLTYPAMQVQWADTTKPDDRAMIHASWAWSAVR